MKKIAVLSHREDHFKDFLRYMDPGDWEKFERISRPEHVHGREFAEVLRVGPYWHLRDAQKVYELALTRVKP